MTIESLANSTDYEEGQSLGHARINETTRRLAVGPSLRVLDKDLTAAPGSPTDGQSYVVAGTPGGGDAWEGHGGSLEIATFWGSSWFFRPILVGEVFTIVDEKVVVVVGTGSAPDFETIHTYT